MPRPRPRSAHPWDGFLTGPENELAFAGVQALAAGRARGDLAAGGPWPFGGGQVAAAGGAGGRVARAGTRRGRSPTSTAAAVRRGLPRPRRARRDGDGWAELRRRFRVVDLLVLEDIEGLERAPWPATS